VPGFVAAEEGDADVAVELEGVSGGGDGAAIGMAGFGVVEMAVGEVPGVGLAEAGADGEAAERAIAEGGVGVFVVGGFGRGGGEFDDGEADVAAAGGDADDGVCGGLPIATDAGGGSGEGGGSSEKEGKGDETHGDSSDGEDIAGMGRGRGRSRAVGDAERMARPPGRSLSQGSEMR